jgi:hypothetical protein
VAHARERPARAPARPRAARARNRRRAPITRLPRGCAAAQCQHASLSPRPPGATTFASPAPRLLRTRYLRTDRRDGESVAGSARRARSARSPWAALGLIKNGKVEESSSRSIRSQPFRVVDVADPITVQIASPPGAWDERAGARLPAGRYVTTFPSRGGSRSSFKSQYLPRNHTDVLELRVRLESCLP